MVASRRVRLWPRRRNPGAEECVTRRQHMKAMLAVLAVSCCLASSAAWAMACDACRGDIDCANCDICTECNTGVCGAPFCSPECTPTEGWRYELCPNKHCDLATGICGCQGVSGICIVDTSCACGTGADEEPPSPDNYSPT